MSANLNDLRLRVLEISRCKREGLPYKDISPEEMHEIVEQIRENRRTAATARPAAGGKKSQKKTETVDILDQET